MYKIHNFLDNDDINIVENNGAFTIIEYKKDLSVSPETAMLAHFCAEMNIKKRQVVCDLNKANVTMYLLAPHNTRIVIITTGKISSLNAVAI